MKNTNTSLRRLATAIDSTAAFVSAYQARCKPVEYFRFKITGHGKMFMTLSPLSKYFITITLISATVL
jgi:hypothetical protein